MNLNLLEEVHGDTCRLGYLKLLSCLGDDFQPYSMEYFSSRLFSLTKDHYKHWKFPRELSATGLITDKQGLTICRNYVKFAYDFGVLNRRNQTLGPFGRIFSKTQTAKSTLEYIRNQAVRFENILVLNEFERILFLKHLLEADGLAISHILKWLRQLAEEGQEMISRRISMNHFMEEIYPDMMQILSSSSSDYSKKIRLREAAERAKSFRKERLKLEKEGKWGMSDLYAKYRHIAPPRFEWLIDLRLLEKKTRGNYRITPLAGKVYDTISKITFNSFGDEAFYQLGKMYLGFSNEASWDDIKALLVDCYMRFEKAGHLAVDRTLFENFVAFEALEIQKKLVKISSVDKVIEDIQRLDPKMVQYHVDMSGKWRFIKISKELAKGVALS